jgi:Arc/MetJ-type ribon-helix-helix transcriptional regulator
LETEKVCVNLSAAELGKLDVLVAQGVYVSRTDVVRAALRREFDVHADVIDRHLETSASSPPSKAAGYKVVRTFTGIGYTRFTAEFLEELVRRGEKAEVLGAGIVTIDDDVSPDLADRGIHRLRLLGSVRGPRAVLDRISDRIHRSIG